MAVRGAPVPQIGAAQAERVRSLDSDIARVEREGLAAFDAVPLEVLQEELRDGCIAVVTLLTKRCQRGEPTLAAASDKEAIVTTTRPGFVAFRESVDREVFEPGFALWERAAGPLRRVWRALIRLPDRGRGARPDEVPPEYYRFPPF